jgi:hypothetical protein
VLPSGARLTVTVSVGSTWTAEPIDLPTLLGQADGALYAAKAAGRDGCELAKVSEHESGRTPEAASGETVSPRPLEQSILSAATERCWLRKRVCR